ncbi:MAG: 16S rRNA (cytosine(967)-C(5))-methyltransferase RsmB [Spongiibacter sp.]|nr:16S rRNA (cytosine(967)-C(5))-methyltransferase RsmB [Spongiibacter sp.]
MSCPRIAAAQCLAAIVGDGQSLSRQLTINETKLPENQRSLYRELCYGTLRQYWRLDAALKPCFSRPLKKRDLDIKMLVYVGAYQLFHTRVPHHAAINSCVEGARKLNKKWAAGMINAILRRCQREGNELFEGLSPAAASSHPQWLHKAISQAWPEAADQIFTANNSHPPFCLRVNAQHSDRDAYLDALRAEGIGASHCAFSARGLRLDQAVPVSSLPGFAEGSVSVQDEAAQLCTDLLDLAPGQRVLDACAAPGGKTCAILEAEPALDEVVALDVDGQRLERVEDNLERLGLRASCAVADASTTDWWDGRHFDRILLDAPCSATGVLRRNPDIRLHRRAEDIAELAALQGKMLDALWQCLAPGGRLVYATCSVLPAENTSSVGAFLARHSDARHIEIKAPWGLNVEFGRQILPQTDGADGFFYAVLSKDAA